MHVTINSKSVKIRDYISGAFAKSRVYRRLIDQMIVGVLTVCAVLVLFMLFNIILQLMLKGASSVNLDFFLHLPKPVGEIGGGMANCIAGTLMLLGIAVAVGVPVGMGTGIYLSEYAGQKFGNTVRFLTDILNGIPSIVYGIFVYTIMVKPLKSFSALSGGVALGIMMIPMVARTTEGFIKMVPESFREAGLALGAPKWRVILNIVLPSALGGIVTGIMVSLARVAGETAPLIFTAFGNQFWHKNLMEPIAALPLQIFAFAISPFDDWHRQAWAGALVLIILVFSINLLAGYFVNRQKKMFSGENK